MPKLEYLKLKISKFFIILSIISFGFVVLIYVGGLIDFWDSGSLFQSWNITNGLLIGSVCLVLSYLLAKREKND